MEARKIRLVKVKKVHPSSVLPSRTRGPEVGESVKSVGVQQPLIVRPIKSSPDEYELINGKIRYDSLDSEQEVYVDIREDATDSDVFKTSEATFQRKDRSAYEKACFYNKWLGTLEKEKGEQALQSQLAKLANLSESAVSQYLAIYDVFEKLKLLDPGEEFNALKSWSVNKLYRLSEVSKDPDFLEIAQELEKKGDISIEEIEHSLSERQFNKMKEVLASLDEGGDSTESKADSTPANFSTETGIQHAHKNCLNCAQKVGKLETETHQTLSTLVQKMLTNTEKFSSGEILEILNSLLQTLRKLKKHTRALHEKMESQN